LIIQIDTHYQLNRDSAAFIKETDTQELQKLIVLISTYALIYEPSIVHKS